MQFDESWDVLTKALYYDKQGDWHKAHTLVDSLAGKKAARIHAYLHRKEGDEWNARYWYNRADAEFFDGSLEEEWAFLWDRYGKL
jgi:hypothetical protein